MAEDAGTKKSLVGLAFTVVTGAFIGVSVAKDLSLTTLVVCWGAWIVALYLFSRWKPGQQGQPELDSTER